MIRAASIFAFWRARSRLEKAVAVLVPVVLLLELVPLPGALVNVLELIQLLTFAAVAVLAVRYLRAAILVLMWRLRNRLLVAYVFIGVVPVVLVLGMAALAAYIFYGQVATYMAFTEVEQMQHELALALRGVAEELPARGGGDLENLEEMLRPHLPPRLAQTRPRVRLLEPGDVPAWLRLKGDFQGLARSSQGYDVRAVVAAGQRRLLVTIPIERALPAWLPGTVGTTSFLGLPAPRAVASYQPGGSSKVVLGEDQYEMKPVATGPPLPPRAHWADVAVNWPLTVEVTDWETGSTRPPGVLIVHTRPGLINLRLFSTMGELSRLPLTLLAVVAILFLVIEFFSLLIGVRLTRTITQAVASLYQATERVHAGDFSVRVPVRSRDQLAALASSFNTMAASLEQLILEQKEKQRMQSELEIARGVQARLFPKEVPSLGGLELAGVCQPARTVSGDYYDFVAFDQNRLAVIVGDIAGKGISAALLMASIQSMVHAQLSLAGSAHRSRVAVAAGEPAREAVGGTAAEHHFDTAALVAELNHQLHRNIAPSHFATFCFAVYNDAIGELTYTNAGHLPPMILRGGQLRRLDKGGTVLGVFPSVRYDQETVRLEHGDLLVAYTDGITEPENSYGEEFGEARLLEILRRVADRPPEEIIRAVMAAVGEWSATPEPQDDMTVLVARRR